MKSKSISKMNIGDKLMDYKRILKKYTLILRITTVLLIILLFFLRWMALFRKFHYTVDRFSKRRWSSRYIKKLLK